MEMIITIIIVSLTTLIGIALLCFFIIRQKIYINFVQQNSLRLKQLEKINRNFVFYPNINFNQTHTYDNENFYTDISCKDYLIYQLQFIKKDISEQIEKIHNNKLMYENYKKATDSIKQTGNFQKETGKLNLNKLIKIEKTLIQRETIPQPVTQFCLTVCLYCSKINGQIYSAKSDIFYDTDIQNLIFRLNKKRGNYYTDREIWDAICRVERGKVSNKMRFSIYARDGYRCCKCGASGRYAQLEVDHIVPIAKGGKSTYNNLQTLCHKCNVEKGDKLY